MSEIRISHLTKRYGSSPALDDVNLTFGGNQIYGLLGRNGAGKTTLLNLMCGRLFPTAGEVTLDGTRIMENEAALRSIFCVVEQNLYPETMRVEESFRWTKEFYPSFDLAYAEELARKFGLKRNKRLDSLSTGYSTIAKLILALAVNAPFVLYDEPVLGLDANHRELFYRELLHNYMEHPKTVVLSTHIIEEISDLLERVVILKGRRIAIDDSAEHLLRQAYSVAGAQAAVEQYCKGSHCIGTETMASFASAAILGERGPVEEKKAAELHLELSGLELQKLFVYLTNGEEEEE